MDWFLLQPTSVEQIARCLFTGILACYLLGVKNKSMAARWLAAAFVALTADGIADFMGQSVYAPWYLYFAPVQFVSILIIILSLLMFAYAFLENPFPRESKIVLFLTGLFILGYTGFLAYQLFAYGRSVNLLIFLFSMEIAGTFLVVWLLVVLLRKTMRLSEVTNSSARLVSRGSFRTLTARLAVLATRLVKPKGRTASAHRAFALLSVFLLVNILANLTEDFGLIPEQVGAYLKFTGMLIFFMGFVVVYINHAPEPTTLPVKLVGFTLILVLALLAILVHVIEKPAERMRESGPFLLPDRQAVRFDPDESGGYRVTSAPFHFDPILGEDLGFADNDTATVALGFAFPFFGSSWREVLVEENAAVLFGSDRVPAVHSSIWELPLIAPLLVNLNASQGGGVFYKLEPDKATITWHQIPRSGTSALNTIQLVLYKQGAIAFVYDRIDAPMGYWIRGIRPEGSDSQFANILFTADLPYTLAAGTGLREDYEYASRRLVHEKMIPLAFVVLACTLFILLVFPLLFRTSLVKPLDRLLNGVRQVNEGDLEAEVTVRANDEIGTLTRNFNLMTTSLRTAQTNLRAHAEDLEVLKNRLQAENTYLQDEIKLQHNFGNIITRSETLKRVLRSVEQVAATDATVLITGESGTGKELLARAIHQLSLRGDRPLVKVNCAALPAELIESELFGHEKGAFTGAIAKKIGRFELADGGTIFLDEIGDLPLGLQAKLLRVLQEGEFERLGSPKTITVDVRVIAATNRDLEREKEEGHFREDLYYRLCVVPIESPPLRARKEDIPLLVTHFVKKYSKKVGKQIEAIPQSVIDTLQGYHWPGNVRELENVIERAVILSPGKKLVLGDWLSKAPTASDGALLCTLEENERRHILKALELTGGRVSGAKGAAKLLNINPNTLTSRMKKLGLRGK